MNANECLSNIPSEIQAAPWLKSIVDLLQEQARIIQEQTRVIQEQAEQITSLKKTAQELKDEITRLTKTPKRPKFRPGGGDPKNRSGAPGNNAGGSGSNTANRMVPQKVQQEVRVPAVGVPEGSRFKGYQTYVVQELEIVLKDITYKLEVWQSPDGTVVRAPLPLEIQGSHFGHQLRALVHNLYALGMTEPGLVGFISETILKPGQVLLSDRAGQFAVFNHAACWVHMERPLRKLECATPEAEKELGQTRGAIWVLYEKVKEAAMTQTGKEEVHELYDQFIAMKSISPGINEVIASFAQYREEMLKALDHPSLPLHNNDSERDIRSVAKRRNISGTTKSIEGREFRDGLCTLKQTCARIGVSFYGYLKAWFKREPMDLADIVRKRYRGPVVRPSG